VAGGAIDAERLTRFLNWTDRFFGDAGMADRTLFPHAFGLRVPAPLWTAPAFNRCLLLALAYPVVSIFIIWAVSGHVGPAEAAMGLKPSLPGWQRGVSLGEIGLFSAAWWRFVKSTQTKLAERLALYPPGLISGWRGYFRTKGWKVLIWLILACIVLLGALAIVGPVFVILVLIAAMAAYLIVPFAYHGAGNAAGAISLGMALALSMVLFVREGLFIIFGCAYASIFVLMILGILAVRHGRQGVFLAILVPAMVIACLVAADVLPSVSIWGIAGPLLLILGLLTLLNAPFDWGSLGLTRSLLRRGLELGGWWLYALALLDAGLAAVIMGALAVTMVMGVQAFDTLAVHGGGAPCCHWSRYSMALQCTLRPRSIGGSTCSCCRP
jgi:hypothetical protein